jgi:hypothetical protein
MLHSYFLDTDIIIFDPMRPRKDINLEPLFINKPGSWALRPPAASKIWNFFLAADYVQTNSDLACMEAANEAARRAVNALLTKAGSSASRCKIWDMSMPEIFAPWRASDWIRYKEGLPWDGDLWPGVRPAPTRSYQQPGCGEWIEALPLAVAYFAFGFFNRDRFVLPQDPDDRVFADAGRRRDGDDDAGGPALQRRPMLVGFFSQPAVGAGERSREGADSGTGCSAQHAADGCAQARANSGADSSACRSALPNASRLGVGMLVAADRKGAVLTGRIVVKAREAVVRNAGGKQCAHRGARAARGVVGTCKDCAIWATWTQFAYLQQSPFRRPSALYCTTVQDRRLSPLDDFHPAVANWFRRAFTAPTEPQVRAWPQIRAGRNVLIAAPTGSGKTLAAFLAAIDSLVRQGLGKGLPMKRRSSMSRRSRRCRMTSSATWSCRSPGFARS